MSSSYIYCFNKGSGTCPFYNSDGLCSLQLKMGHDFIPEACRMFPRFYRNYGPFEEHYLDLACIEAARQFLEGCLNMHLEVSEGEPLSEPCTTNDDAGLLTLLRHTREECILMVQKADTPEALASALKSLDNHAGALQKAALSGDELPDTVSPCKTESGPCLFPLDLSFYRRIMDTSFYNIRLRRSNPALYRLLRLYFDDPGHILASDESFKTAAGDFFKNNKEAAKYLAAYYAYYLYLYYLKSFEDYSFVRNIRIGIVHLNMILLLCVLHTGGKSTLSVADLSQIIAAYNRRAYFNEEIVDELYHCLDPLDPSSFA